jgi:hypothetical protein
LEKGQAFVVRIAITGSIYVLTVFDGISDGNSPLSYVLSRRTLSRLSAWWMSFVNVAKSLEAWVSATSHYFNLSKTAFRRAAVPWRNL